MLCNVKCKLSASAAYSIHSVEVEDIVRLVLLVELLDLGQDLGVVANSAGRWHQAWCINETHTDAIEGALQNLHLRSWSSLSG